MTEEEALEAINAGRKVRIFHGGVIYEGNLFLGDSRSFRFLGHRIDKPSEEIIAIVPLADLSYLKAI